jgi:hypothetical protein
MWVIYETYAAGQKLLIKGGCFFILIGVCFAILSKIKNRMLRTFNLF